MSFEGALALKSAFGGVVEPGTVVLPGDFFGAFVSGGTVVGFVPGTVVGVAVAVAAVPPTETFGNAAPKERPGKESGAFAGAPKLVSPPAVVLAVPNKPPETVVELITPITGTVVVVAAAPMVEAPAALPAGGSNENPPVVAGAGDAVDAVVAGTVAPKETPPLVAGAAAAVAVATVGPAGAPPKLNPPIEAEGAVVTTVATGVVVETAPAVVEAGAPPKLNEAGAAVVAAGAAAAAAGVAPPD